ncbi:ArsC family reductase [Kaarinaea lacus]
MAVTILFGIRNCDTVRKARKWLDSEGIDYSFHDFRADGLTKKDLTNWVKAVGWDVLLNKRGTTWRQLPDKKKESVDERKAIDLMLANPTLIKRPVLARGKKIHVGFSTTDYKNIFK